MYFKECRPALCSRAQSPSTCLPRPASRPHPRPRARRAASQGQGQLSTKMVFRPASLASGFHKRLTAQVDRAHVRQSKVRATTTLADPGKAKEEQERAEEQRIRER